MKLGDNSLEICGNESLAIPDIYELPPVNGGKCGVLKVTVITSDSSYPPENMQMKKIKLEKNGVINAHDPAMLGTYPPSDEQNSSTKKGTLHARQTKNMIEGKRGDSSNPKSEKVPLAHIGICFRTRMLFPGGGVGTQVVEIIEGKCPRFFQNKNQPTAGLGGGTPDPE